MSKEEKKELESKENKEGKGEEFEKALDGASEVIMKKLNIDALISRVDGLEKTAEKEKTSKLASLVNLEELMKKGVDEMTTQEKIIGFFQGIIRNDHVVLKALSEGVAADGGYLFPDEFRAEIIRDIEDKPHMRAEVRVLPMKRDVMKIPTLISGPKVTWTDELAAKSTTTARFNEATLTAYKMAAINAITKSRTRLKSLVKNVVNSGELLFDRTILSQAFA